MQSKLREHPPVIWQCKHCGIWWGSEGDDATAPGLLNEATDDPDDPNDLEWEAYRGWMAPGEAASKCPECGRPARRFGTPGS